MKKLLVLTTIALLVMAMAVSAQEEKKMHFGLGAGLSMPSGTLSDGWKMGFHGAGSLGFAVSKGVEVGPALEYHTFSVKAGVDGAKFSALMIMGQGRYFFPTSSASFSPYLSGGFGFGMAKIGEFSFTYLGTTYTSPSVSETKMAFSIGAGGSFKAGEAMSLFVEGRYTSIMTEGESMSFMPITAGVRF